jgi:hypothetical protein
MHTRSTIPGILQKDQAKRLLAGSIEVGETVAFNAEFHATMAEVAKVHVS